MENTTKLTRLLSTCRHEREACDWVFTLIPISVAFVFYVLFIMSENLEHSGVFIAYGAAAGLSGIHESLKHHEKFIQDANVDARPLLVQGSIISKIPDRGHASIIPRKLFDYSEQWFGTGIKTVTPYLLINRVKMKSVSE